MVTAVWERTHLPEHPSFDCSTCGEPWPCAPAKVELSEEYLGDVISLAMYLSQHMAEAVDAAVRDRRWRQVDNLYDRFLGWVPKGKGDRRAA
jgi:hypothetical protein